jgi:ABC-2 type transport system permease protein
VANVDVPPEATSKMEEAISNGLSNFKFSLFIYFLIYFAGGYLMYASLFAAVGSAVDQESDAQQLTGIIGIPVILPMIFIGSIIQNPNGMLAFWFSIIPFFSPIIMLTRLGAVDVPLWEIALSIFLLIGGVALGMWIAARIYRIGILMYGKKVTLKELGKWLVARNLN